MTEKPFRTVQTGLLEDPFFARQRCYNDDNPQQPEDPVCLAKQSSARDFAVRIALPNAGEYVQGRPKDELAMSRSD